MKSSAKQLLAVLFIKRIGERPEFLCGAAVLISFLLQGTVNNPVIFVTPVLFVILGNCAAGLAAGRTASPPAVNRLT